MNNYTQYQVKELLALIAKDDTAAFTELYDRFWKPLFTIAYNRLKEKESAEDVVHDVFASLWLNRQQGKIESPKQYLAVSVKYAVLSRLKRKIREKDMKNKIQTPYTTEPSPEEAFHHKLVLERIRQEVEELPEKCRLIFKCSRDAGMPVKTIARELHLSPKTVENQLTRALRHLKMATRSFLHAGILGFFLLP